MKATTAQRIAERISEIKGSFVNNDEDGNIYVGYRAKVNSKITIKKTTNEMEVTGKIAILSTVENIVKEELLNEETEFNAPAMDSRIVKLNELKSVKMANLSKGKRPAAKEAKELAVYILNNWDNFAELINIKIEDVKDEALQNILESRIQNHRDSLQKAGEAAKKAIEGKGANKTKASKDETKPEPKKEATKKVGDMHKNGKWVWTEYKPGKFDWRTIPSQKQKTGAKPKVETEGKKAEKKASVKKSSNAEKSNAKQSKKGETKKSSPEAPKQLTIEDFIAMPKSAKSNKKPSPSQAEALKLIQKGYWIWNNGGAYFFKNAIGDTKQCNMDSVLSMFKRYGIDYIPEGLVK